MNQSIGVYKGGEKMEADHNQNSKSSKFDSVKEVRDGLIWGSLLMLFGILFAHYVLNMPFFP